MTPNRTGRSIGTRRSTRNEPGRLSATVNATVSLSGLE